MKHGILFYDFETTGLPACKTEREAIRMGNPFPPDPLARGNPLHYTQPFPVSVAMVLTDNTRQANIISETYTLIQLPPGVQVQEGAAKIHGISTEKANAEGAPLASVLAHFIQLAHSATRPMAYNDNFDDTVLKANALRCGLISCPPPFSFPPYQISSCALRQQLPGVFGTDHHKNLSYHAHMNDELYGPNSSSMCLMKLASNFTRVPGGTDGFRTLKLGQTFRRVCGIPMEAKYEAHNALDDVRACVDIYRELVKVV